MALRNRRSETRRRPARALPYSSRQSREARRTQRETNAATEVGEPDISQYHERLVGLRARAIQARKSCERHGLSGWRKRKELRSSSLRQPDRQRRYSGDGGGLYFSRHPFGRQVKQELRIRYTF